MHYKNLNNNEPYDGYIHIVRATKYRKKLFDSNEKREFMYQLIKDVFDEQDGASLVMCTVAFDHIHILAQFDSKNAFDKLNLILWSRSSRLMRETYPELKTVKALWSSSKSYRNIEDETHLHNCISYIESHNPDNSKTAK
jgi:putative transposase